MHVEDVGEPPLPTDPLRGKGVSCQHGGWFPGSHSPTFSVGNYWGQIEPMLHSTMRARALALEQTKNALFNDSGRSLFQDGDLRLSLCFPLYQKFNNSSVDDRNYPFRSLKKLFSSRVQLALNL